ncbi:DUF1398 family protein [Chitinophaga sp. 30R24]|uniref:DUF1398 family protein n=1 Tax=Chitinophaga sp. 30R24 TaxID=3248838 RepID=UPI003B9024DE
MTGTITKTINIKANPGLVWDYVNNLSLWAEWAVHNVKKVSGGEDGFYLMEGPRGISKVKMRSDKSLGILDHDFIDPGEGHWRVPCRVVAGNEGAHFMITFTKPVQMPEEAFEVGMKQFDDELAQLKSILEALPYFTVEQIKAAHSTVKSGADFPKYIQDIKALGVTFYETFLHDGHTDYYGKNDYKVSSTPNYSLLHIADEVNEEQLRKDIKNHQNGGSDYFEICRECANNGVNKWAVCMRKMTCTYYDKSGHVIMVEAIPIP